VYQLSYNLVTDHVVAGGKKLLRFFGMKEGALNDAKSATLRPDESKLWAKKGTCAFALSLSRCAACAQTRPATSRRASQ
jgi:hypothetical protein